LMLVSPRVDFIDLRVSGPRTLLGRIDRERLAIVLDVSGVRPGPAAFRILPDSLALPRGLTVARLTPSEVTLEWARTADKTVPVKLELMGTPPSDLRITDTKVAPESVNVFGPEDEVRKLKVAKTLPLDLSNAKPGLLERDLALEVPGEYASYSASLVHVQVRLEEPQETRILKNVQIVVRNSDYQANLKPSTVKITVRGPRSAVQSLELAPGAVYTDAKERGPGNYRETPSVELPAAVELVKLEPEKVRLQLAAAE